MLEHVYKASDTSYAAPQNHTPRSWKASSSVVATIETADTALAIVAPRSHGGRPGSSLVYIGLPKRCSLSSKFGVSAVDLVARVLPPDESSETIAEVLSRRKDERLLSVIVVIDLFSSVVQASAIRRRLRVGIS
jgi:hypothetical protein